jgi:hypothetical protein
MGNRCFFELSEDVAQITTPTLTRRAARLSVGISPQRLHMSLIGVMLFAVAWMAALVQFAPCWSLVLIQACADTFVAFCLVAVLCFA